MLYSMHPAVAISAEDLWCGRLNLIGPFFCNIEAFYARACPRCCWTRSTACTRRLQRSEAALAAAAAAALLAAGGLRGGTADLGVITPYSGQVDPVCLLMTAVPQDCRLHTGGELTGAQWASCVPDVL